MTAKLRRLKWTLAIVDVEKAVATSFFMSNGHISNSKSLRLARWEKSADDVLKYIYLFFPRKYDLTFHALNRPF